MGWNPFKSEKRTTVGTAVSRVIEDKLLPDSLKTGLLAGLFSGDQLVENILEELVASIGVRAERMYQYGKNGYLFGVPSSHVLSSGSGTPTVKAVLEAIEGRPVTIEYSQYGSLNNLHYGWLTLVTDYGYSQYTNELVTLSAAKAAKVYLTDLQVVVAEATAAELQNGTLSQWGNGARAGYSPLRPTQNNRTVVSTTPFDVDAAATSDYFRLSYAWLEGVTLKTETITFPMTTLDPYKGYFQVKYSYGSLTDYIPPEGGSDLSKQKVDEYTKYWTYLDGEGTWLGLDGLYTPEYNHLGSFFPFGYFRFDKHSTASDTDSTEYASSKKLMEYLGMDFGDVAEAINNNPDIDDVESALLLMAVPAQTDNALEKRYLFDFFKEVYSSTLGFTPASSAISNDIANLLKNSSSALSVVIQDARFKMSINMSGVYRKICMGSAETEGTYTSGYSTYHWYRHQLTPYTYEEIQVHDLGTSYFISGGYKASGTDGDSNLLIPLDRAITTNYPAFDRETLYARSLHYVFNSKVVTKVKWYQQEWFSTFLTVIAVVITVISWGSSGSAMAATIAAATASVSALLTAVFIAVIKYLVVKTVFKLFVKIVGVKFAMILAVVAACYGVYGSMGTSGVAGAPWANELLQASTGLTNAIQGHYADALIGIQEEAEEFGIYAKEKYEELDTANSLLDTNNLLNPFVIFGESPTDYYDRTCHSGNIGVIGLDAVSAYVDVALTLPTLDRTLSLLDTPAYG